MKKRGMSILVPMLLSMACGAAGLVPRAVDASPQAAPATGKAGSAPDRIWKFDYFDNFYDVASAGSRDPSNLWIVGNNGRILHSSDGGKSWVIQSGASKENLYAASFVDARRGWCAGSNGVILHTEDGGSTWSLQKTGTSHPIFRIQFLSEKTGFACGYFGLILRTADGGKTWENKSLGEDVTLRGMHFLGEKVGYIVGEFGTVLKTSDGGSTFTRQTSPIPLTLFAVHFANENAGYASGIDGTLIGTSDGGRTWRKEESGTKDHLIGIRSNGPVALAVGLRGAVTARQPGGKWAAVDAKTLNWLSGILLGEGGKGYAVGAHGTILRLEEILDKGRGK